MLAIIFEPTRRHVPEDLNLHRHTVRSAELEIYSLFFIKNVKKTASVINEIVSLKSCRTETKHERKQNMEP